MLAMRHLLCLCVLNAWIIAKRFDGTAMHFDGCSVQLPSSASLIVNLCGHTGCGCCIS